MKGKIALIAAGNGPVAEGAAIALGSMGAVVVLACNDMAAGAGMVARVKSTAKTTGVHLINMDASSLQSVKKAVTDFKSRSTKLDVLINIPDLSPSGKDVTEDGFDKVFERGFLGNFLLVQLLLASTRPGARLINVISKPPARHFHLQNIIVDSHHHLKYAVEQTALANAIFTDVLARKQQNTGVTVNGHSPGIIPAKQPENKGMVQKLLGAFSYILPDRVEPVASEVVIQTVTNLATSVGLEKITGKFFIGDNEIASPTANVSEGDAMQFYQQCLQLAGLVQGASAKR
jgi:NAD(P)-dependent dehydrogenase (short-subunit alcohol dehydrogenase family)